MRERSKCASTNPRPYLMTWMRHCPISQGDVWHTNRGPRPWFNWESLTPIWRSVGDLLGQLMDAEAQSTGKHVTCIRICDTIATHKAAWVSGLDRVLLLDVNNPCIALFDLNQLLYCSCTSYLRDSNQFSFHFSLTNHTCMSVI